MTRPDDPGLVWTEHGPRSGPFDDIYFSTADGLAETRLVFLQGAGLPDAWRGRRRFTVGELGFGTGLNVAALLQLWRTERPADGRLTIFSVEAFPIGRDDAARALGHWPDLAQASEGLLAAWPDGRRGFHRIDLPSFHATLDLFIGEVGEALAAWGGAADAWFLDGFAPSRNPQMWRDVVLAAVASHCRPGARVATFTVAGQVRRGLDAAGFSLSRQPGFGHKRERLEATWPGVAADPPQAGRVAILGAGIAGAALARALAAEGIGCIVVDAEGSGAGASGNPAALVTPRLDAGFGPAARLHAQAFARAVPLLAATGAVIARGALQLEVGPRDAERFARVAAWDGFTPGAVALCDAETTVQRLAEASAPAGLMLRDALVVQPRRVLQAWLGGVEVRRGRAGGLHRSGNAWRVLDDAGEVIAEAQAVCIALGPDSGALMSGLGLRAVRGQIEVSPTTFDGAPAAWGGYAIPTADGSVLFGATHQRGDAISDPRLEDRQRNLHTLAAVRPRLAARIAQARSDTLTSRAGVRAATPDHLPLTGEVAHCPGVYVLSGLGGRGFTLAPLLAEHIASRIAGTPSPLPQDLADRLDPNRFRHDKGRRRPDAPQD